VDVLPDASLLPFVQSSPAGHPATAAHLFGKVLPGDAGLEYEKNASQRFAVVDGLSTTFGSRLVWWETGFDEFPELVREQRLGHWFVLHDNQQIEIAAYSSAHLLVEHDVLLDALSNRDIFSVNVTCIAASTPEDTDYEEIA